jgi:hypothetical protein
VLCGLLSNLSDNIQKSEKNLKFYFYIDDIFKEELCLMIIRLFNPAEGNFRRVFQVRGAEEFPDRITPSIDGKREVSGIDLSTVDPGASCLWVRDLTTLSLLTDLREDNADHGLRARIAAARLAPSLETLDYLPETRVAKEILERFVRGKHGERDIFLAPWQQLSEDTDFPSSPLFSFISVMRETGRTETEIRGVLDTLFQMRVNVSAPCTTGYMILDLMRTTYGRLLGRPTPLKHSLVKDWTFSPLSLGQATVVRPVDERHLHSLENLIRTLREDYKNLMEDTKNLLCSDQNFLAIEEKKQELSRGIINIVCSIIRYVWGTLGIDPKSQALVYMRRMKTRGSDLDMAYFGPKQKEVNKRLTIIAWAVGLQRDYFSTNVFDGEIERKACGYELAHYFFDGTIVEYNGASFDDFLAAVLGRGRPDEIREKVYPYLCRQLAIWSGEKTAREVKLNLTRYDFKHLHIRAIFNLLYCLSVKFNIPVDHNMDRFWTRLGKYFRQEEIERIQEIYHFANHARDLIQCVTNRRWRNKDKRVFAEVESILSHQGIPDMDQYIEENGRFLQGVSRKYLGMPDYRITSHWKLFDSERGQSNWDGVVDLMREAPRINLESE